MSTEQTRTATASGGRTITAVLAAVGAIALIGSGGTAAFAASADLNRTERVQELDATGITALDLEVSSADVTVEFGDVEEARLSVIGGWGADWRLDRDDDELIVRSPAFEFGWWFGNWFPGDQQVVLTLPDDLLDARLETDLVLNAGSLDVAGSFGDVQVEVNAGSLRLEGEAGSVQTEVNAGSAEIELDGVRTADLDLSAGRLVVDLTGDAPEEVRVGVSAGSLVLTVPDVQYRVTQDRSAGSIDSRLDESSRARNTIDVTVSAGSVTLRAD